MATRKHIALSLTVSDWHAVSRAPPAASDSRASAKPSQLPIKRAQGTQHPPRAAHKVDASTSTRSPFKRHKQQHTQAMQENVAPSATNGQHERPQHARRPALTTAQPPPALSMHEQTPARAVQPGPPVRASTEARAAPLSGRYSSPAQRSQPSAIAQAMAEMPDSVRRRHLEAHREHHRRSHAIRHGVWPRIPRSGAQSLGQDDAEVVFVRATCASTLSCMRNAMSSIPTVDCTPTHSGLA